MKMIVLCMALIFIGSAFLGMLEFGANYGAENILKEDSPLNFIYTKFQKEFYSHSKTEVRFIWGSTEYPVTNTPLDSWNQPTERYL